MKDYNWTWDYLLWDISWPVVQRILADAPKYDTSSKKDKEEEMQSLRDKINEIKR